MTEPEITSRDIDKLFKGFQFHHVLIGMPVGVLFYRGIMNKDPENWICAILILVGAFLQSRFFFHAIKKIVDYIRQDL